MELPVSESVLYVVATPIGNLGDLSERAKQVLADADLIAAEDTRHTASLLSMLKLSGKKLVSYYDQIEEKRSDELVKQMLVGALQVALVSDAGTPCISDPGYRLVAKSKAAGIKVIPVPGACAFTSLVSSSGLPCHRFAFIGFLPNKKKSLDDEVSSWGRLNMPVVCYESPRRLISSLEAIIRQYPEARVAIGRELTKIHEEIHTLAIESALAWAREHKNLKGELVMMVDPSIQQLSQEELLEQVRRGAEDLLEQEPSLSHKDLMLRFGHHGLNKKDLYRLLLSLKK
ncbi:MAG: 16S rRNA (cytidine(1402)-2'-O)-methyltransferase [Oligoflexales bacterium]|nr:16S rRNA (cytidine(1402)-2'-O)-methyltransferase [Oligoflexales bacterium]